ncbi:MAG: TonB-dependent receptor [Rubrivivax sp.]
MFKRTKVCAGVLAALGGGLVIGSQPALAQQASERVEITGSRIKSFETETASPVVSISAESIKVEGVRSVEQLLNNLPQVFADYGGQVSNGSTGTATVNLRNLGRSRTLVLVNGRRMPAGSPRELAADLNQIPISLVKRVEVLTGGASAVYGSDAVAGVVNFIMDDRFEGAQIQFNHSFYNHKQKGDINYALDARGFAKPGNITSDGEVTDFNVTLGGNFANGKGNAVVYVGYKKEAAVLQSERDFSACSLGNAGARFSCGGSSTSYPGRFLLADGASATAADAAGGVRPWTSADVYNFGPLNYFQRPSDRYTASMFSRYDINEMARVYSEVSFSDDRTVAQIAPSGLFLGPTYTVNYDNPLLSTAWRNRLHQANQAQTDANGNPAPTNFLAAGDTAAVLIGRRNVEGGGRQDDIRHTSFRVNTGVKGDIGPWSYDAYMNLGKVIYQETYKNDFSVTRSQRALDVVTDPATGAAVCRSALDGTDPNCVPYNIWAIGGVSQAALSYLQTPGFQKGFTSTRTLGASGSVDLGAYGLKLPTAKNGLGLAFGVEKRQEKMDLSTDAAFTTGDLAGQGGPTIGVGGGYSVRDIFGELRVPVLEKLPFAELLNVTATYRNSNYSNNQKTNTWGLGLEYAPVKEAKLRTSLQRAIRAANIIELYSAQAVGLYNAASDPCAGTAPTATLAQCQNTGVTPAQYGRIQDNPAGQYNALFGGNPALKPETSSSLTLGVVLQPIRDLTVTVDYFNIKVDDVISTASPTTTLSKCLTTGAAVYCGKINRDPLGTLWLGGSSIQATNANLAALKTQGVDIGTDYRLKLEGAGQLDFSLLGTMLRKYEITELPGEAAYDCSGLYGSTCGTPSPKWRHKLRTTWTSPWDVALSLTWRYFGAVSDEITSDYSQLKPSGTAAQVDAARANASAQAKLKAQNYFDIAASYNVTKNLIARVAVNNLFDKDPPLAVVGAPFGNGNTYPVVYDALGRKISVNLTASF